MDIVYVSYNSEKWVNRCFESLYNSKYDLKNISVYVVDNGSSDDTISKLYTEKKVGEKLLRKFEIIDTKKNNGFGQGNNIGFKRGIDDIVCFFNIDTELYPNTLMELEYDISNSEKDVALWELRQFPYEHPKIYDPVTQETSWSSGAAFAVRRSVFKKIRGFDEGIFMYAEDVDLSWRIRSFGYKLKYVPKATIKHYSYESVGQVKPTQYINSIINNLLLRYRFGNRKKVIAGNILVWKCIAGPEAYPGSREELKAAYIKHFSKITHFKRKGICGRKKHEVAKFNGFDYETIRDGAFYENRYPEKTPRVSIIVRTCGRPSVLRETLISLKHQTYNNLEIVVVEDGQAISERMIKEEFSDIDIIYKATGEKVGRSKAGNIAMNLATGEYLNFLDDDDLFYADHVEVLVSNIIRSGKLAAYATGFETPIWIKSKDPYVYRIKNYLGIHKQSFDRVMLCHHNYIPIQCIMFAKDLFLNYGGLDENVDALEDWDMWVRYSMYTDFEFVFKTTSIYRVPAEFKVNHKRQKELDEALVVMREKHKGYRQEISVYDMAKLYEKRG